MPSVLFLDIDGVLVTHRSMKAFPRTSHGSPMDPECVRRLRDVIEWSGSKIVLSSTWRLGVGGMSRTRGALAAAGWACAPVSDKTPVADMKLRGLYVGKTRGAEIKEWLDAHPDCERYAIVDDDSDMLPEQMPYFVKTSFEDGLTTQAADRLLDLLTGKQPCGCGINESCICYAR